MKNFEKKRGGSQLNFLDEIIVDNFAGGGGASTGMELATGRPVAIAINHGFSTGLHHRPGLPGQRVRENKAGGPVRERGMPSHGNGPCTGEPAGVV